MRHQVQQGIDIVLYLDGAAVAGQQGAKLQQRMSPINITNKITGQWQENLGGIRDWSIICNGMYVKDQSSFEGLLEAFMNNTYLSVSLVLGNKQFSGRCLITDFPIQATFNSQFKYQISLIGTGELTFETSGS